MSEVVTKESYILNDDEQVYERVEIEYNYYQEIKELVDAVSAAFEALPDGLLLEVRAFTGHISEAITRKQDSLKDRLDNIESAHRHLRRVALDCYKILCIDSFNKIKEFKKKYKFFDLSVLDEGNFVQQLDSKIIKATNSIKTARSLDTNGNNSKNCDTKEFGDVYVAYETAFNDYRDVVKYIDDHRVGASRVAKKNMFWTSLGILGWIITFVLAVISVTK